MASEDVFTSPPRPLPGDNTPPPPVQVDPSQPLYGAGLVVIGIVALVVVVGILWLVVR